MVLESSFRKPIVDLSYSFVKISLDLDERPAGSPINANPKLLNLLWAAKDRSVSLNKTLRSLQKLFEAMNLSDVDEKTKRSVVEAFLKSLEDLKFTSLDALYDLFKEFLDKYPTNFEQFCEQTKGRSNWLYLANNMPELSPNVILESLERSYEFEAKFKDLLTKNEILPETPQDDLADILGDVSRILANQIMMFEDTVDNLFSISLWGNWDDMRDEFGKMMGKRTEELRKFVVDELQTRKEDIKHKLENCDFEENFFRTDFFETHKTELDHQLAYTAFQVVKKAYQQISRLNNPTNIIEVNKKRYEEAIKAIETALAVLTSGDNWDSFRAAHRFSF